MDPILIRAIAFEKDGKWIAQCLEHDLCTSAKNRRQLTRKLATQVRLQVTLDRANGKSPFQDLPKAPEKFWRMYSPSSPQEEVRIRLSWLSLLFKAWHGPRIQASLSVATA